MATTTRPETERAPIERTEHPHIVKSAGTLGGEPRIEDSRFAVRHVLDYVESGMTPGEIAEKWALSLAQVHDALSYAYDHPEEIAHYPDENKPRTVMRKHDNVYVEGRLIGRERLRPEDVPPGATVYTWETLPGWEDEEWRSRASRSASCSTTISMCNAPPIVAGKDSKSPSRANSERNARWTKPTSCGRRPTAA